MLGTPRGPDHERTIFVIEQSLADLVRDDSTRVGRALLLLDQHADEIEKVSSEAGVYTVPSSGGIGFYRVEYGGAHESCSCPDFEYRGDDQPCKHLLALGILAAKRRRSLDCGPRARRVDRRILVDERGLDAWATSLGVV